MTRRLPIILAALAVAGPAWANPCGFEQRGQIVVRDYAIGQTAVPAPQAERLAAFAETAKHRDQICVFAQVDRTGSDAANARVAEARAQGVVRFLADRGVPRDVITVAKQDEAFTFFGLLPDDQAADRRVVVTHN